MFPFPDEVTFMEEIYLCTYVVLLFVETASSSPVTLKVMTVTGVCERKSYCE